MYVEQGCQTLSNWSLQVSLFNVSCTISTISVSNWKKNIVGLSFFMKNIMTGTSHLHHIMLYVLFKPQNFTKTGEQEAVRCDTVASLQKRGCSHNFIINPKNDFLKVSNKPLTAGTNPVQIQPQEISLNLRPGMLLSYKSTVGP